MFDLVAPLIVGLAGSLHCLGMCGPLVVAYSLHLRPAGTDGAADTGFHRVAQRNLWSQGFVHHLAFHSGRIMTYGLLGALASVLAYMVGINQLFAGLRSSITLVAGCIMVLFGLTILKVVPLPLVSLSSFGLDSFFCRMLPRLFGSHHMASKWALGLAVGFLPCMLSWAMIVKAATAPSPLHAFVSMVLFGLGTVPALLFTGLSASLFSLRVRLAGERIAAFSVIVMGLMLVIKGAKYFA
jgi:uncharacterized protein